MSDMRAAKKKGELACCGVRTGVGGAATSSNITGDAGGPGPAPAAAPGLATVASGCPPAGPGVSPAAGGRTWCGDAWGPAPLPMAQPAAALAARGGCKGGGDAGMVVRDACCCTCCIISTCMDGQAVGIRVQAKQQPETWRASEAKLRRKVSGHQPYSCPQFLLILVSTSALPVALARLPLPSPTPCGRALLACILSANAVHALPLPPPIMSPLPVPSPYPPTFRPASLFAPHPPNTCCLSKWLKSVI